MRGREPVGHADEHVDNLTRRPLLRLRPAPKRPAVDQFRDQVLPSIVLADVIDRENVWVIERRDGSRLALKSVARSGVGEIRQEFDGDLTPQLRVERPVDDAHPAFAEQSLDAIRADQGAGLHLQAIQRGERWPIQRGARRGLRQQRLNLATQLWIGVREQRRSFGHVGVDGRLVQFFNPTPTLRIHRHSLGNRPVERWSNRSNASQLSPALELLTPQLPHQPHFGQPPVSHHGIGGHVERLGGFLDAEPAEESHFHHLTLS